MSSRSSLSSCFWTHSPALFWPSSLRLSSAHGAALFGLKEAVRIFFLVFGCLRLTLTELTLPPLSLTALTGKSLLSNRKRESFFWYLLLILRQCKTAD